MYRRISKYVAFSGVMLSSLWVNAELQPVDDSTLSKIDGKAGLTIDIDMGLNVGEFMYKDAGSIVMQNISMGGMNRCGDTGIAVGANSGIAASGNNSVAGADYCGGGGSNVGTAFGKGGQYKIMASDADPSSRNQGDIGRGGGAGGTTGLNNVRIEVDVAGDGTTVERSIPGPFGSSFDIMDNQFFWAWGSFWNFGGPQICGSAATGCTLTLKDGDLFIHGTVTDPTITARSYQSVDFGFEMDRFALQASDYKPGDDITNPLNGTETDTTTLFSNLKMEGYFGGFDLLIENDGNGFGATDANGDGRIDQAESDAGLGYGDANSRIIINSFFEITEMEYDFDIAGIRYEKIAVHNLRGADYMFNFDQSDILLSATSQGFAQTNTQIYAVKDNVLSVLDSNVVPIDRSDAHVDGITLQTRLWADMDIGHLSFGDDGVSIGSQHWTDMAVYTKHTISAH